MEPVIVLSWHPVDGEDLHVAITPEDLETCLPAFIGGCIRARVVQELVTIYPERRDELIKNIMFRWTGTIVEDGDDGGSSTS